jgi:hypothetical protein
MKPSTSECLKQNPKMVGCYEKHITDGMSQG